MSTMKIQPQYLTLSELLQGRLFRIPQYQRAYSWRTKERDDLFSDINALDGEPDRAHFMATIVGLRRPETHTIRTRRYHVVEIVDGQQRTTTLIILLKAIELRLSEKDPDEEAIKKELKELLVKADNLSPLLLQTGTSASTELTDQINRTARASRAAPRRRTAGDFRLGPTCAD